ncbi:hypothetical protein N7454_001540 [Penicillium verhagenii]|nr:hypothetical protein N7454_001540 [Penicillium verhagenii]
MDTDTVTRNVEEGDRIARSLQQHKQLSHVLIEAKNSPTIAAATLQKLQLLVEVLELTNGELETVVLVLGNAEVHALADVAAIYWEPPSALNDKTLWQSNLLQREPTAALCFYIKSDRIKIPCQAEVVAILTAAYRKGHDIRATSYRELVAQVAAPSREALRSFQQLRRLCALTFSPEEIAALITLGYESARSVAVANRDRFMESVEGAGLSSLAASRLHEAASIITIRNEQTWARILSSQTKDLLPAIRKPDDDEESEEKTAEKLEEQNSKDSTSPGEPIDKKTTTELTRINETPQSSRILNNSATMSICFERLRLPSAAPANL